MRYIQRVLVGFTCGSQSCFIFNLIVGKDFSRMIEELCRFCSVMFGNTYCCQCVPIFWKYILITVIPSNWGLWMMILQNGWRCGDPHHTINITIIILLHIIWFELWTCDNQLQGKYHLQLLVRFNSIVIIRLHECTKYVFIICCSCYNVPQHFIRGNSFASFPFNTFPYLTYLLGYLMWS